MTEEEVRKEILRCGLFHKKWTDREEAWISLWKRLNVKNPESLLNVGLGPNNEALRWMEFLHKVFPSIQYFVHLEIEESIVKKASLSNKDNPLISNIVLGDIRKLSHMGNKNFDVLFWSISGSLAKVEAHSSFKICSGPCGKNIIIQCPWGSYYDFAVDHVVKNIDKDEFEPFGYEVRYVCQKDAGDGEIIGWRLNDT